MPIIAKANKGDFTPAPEGLHRAVCVDVVDIGMVAGQFGLKHKVEIRWQTEERIPATNKPFLVVKRYGLSLHKKSVLRPDLESWRGKSFTDEEAGGFDLERLIGANCQINVVHNSTDSGTYANVKTVVPAPKGLAPLKVEDYTRVCLRPGYKAPEMPEIDETPIPDDADAPSDDDIPF